MSDIWARRKAAVEAEAKAEEAALVDAAIDQAELDALSDAEVLEQLQLPAPESLGEGDDFKVFWSKAVPSRIRTRALRRLWRVNPILANVDGLVDYGEDFTDAALVVEGLETAYQVGKGMTAHVEELLRQSTEDTSDPEPVTAEAPSEGEMPEETATRAQRPVTPDAQPAEPTEREPDEFDAAPASMGRMRFRFERAAQA